MIAKMGFLDFTTSRREFCRNVEAFFGRRFSREACDELHHQARKIRAAGGRVKVIHDVEVGRFFAYDPYRTDSGLKSLAVALCEKYKKTVKVPEWLAKRAVAEPIELALCGIEVRGNEVEAMCGMFPWLGADPEKIWAILTNAVASADSAAERDDFETEISESVAAPRARRI